MEVSISCLQTKSNWMPKTSIVDRHRDYKHVDPGCFRCKSDSEKHLLLLLTEWQSNFQIMSREKFTENSAHCACKQQDINYISKFIDKLDILRKQAKKSIVFFIPQLRNGKSIELNQNQYSQGYIDLHWSLYLKSWLNFSAVNLFQVAKNRILLELYWGKKKQVIVQDF